VSPLESATGSKFAGTQTDNPDQDLKLFVEASASSFVGLLDLEMSEGFEKFHQVGLFWFREAQGKGGIVVIDDVSQQQNGRHGKSLPSGGPKPFQR
jgi:hypothetical protein